MQKRFTHWIAILIALLLFLQTTTPVLANETAEQTTPLSLK